MDIKTPLRRISLQKKILVTNVIFFALPCLILSWQIISFVQKEANQRLNQSRLAILNQINNSMADMLNSIVVYSDFFFSNSEVNSLLSKRNYDNDYEKMTADKEMQAFLRNRWIYYGNTGYYLEILGENKRNYSSHRNEQADFTPSNLENLKAESWYPALVQSSRIQYIPTYRSKEFSKDASSAVRAVRLLKHLNSGRPIGLMDVSIQQEQFLKLFEDAAQKENQKIFLMDDTGYIISCTDRALIGNYVSSENGLKKLLGYSYGYFPSTINGVYSQICFTTNPITNWKIVMYESMQHSAWFSNRSYLWIMGIAIFYFLLAVLMSVYNARYISRPVRKLKEDMRTAYNGDLSVRTQVETEDEFGQLSQQFNQMLDRIESLIQQLGEQEEEKRVLELNALQAQINPHFLYNTLASIRFLLEMEQKEKADDSLLALAKLLKRTFSDYRELVPVSEELEALRNYLVLMENRYQDTFRWEIKMEETVRDSLIPRVSIQPLVENSISHGFGQMEEMGYLSIHAGKDGDDLLIRVTDNGKGVHMDQIHQLLETPGNRQEGRVRHIGIRNVQERIRLSFGIRYGLTIRPMPDGGTGIDMRMPLRTADGLGKETDTA